MFFHNFNARVLQSIIKENTGKYTHYIIIPFEDAHLEKYLKDLPSENLYLLDIYPGNLKTGFIGVYQDFENDIYNQLKGIKELAFKYNSLELIIKIKTTYIPFKIQKGFERFCSECNIAFRITESPVSGILAKNTGYIVVDDNDLVDLIIQSKKQQLKPGIDIGILSYNESPLKEVIADGISVVSTDFPQMGRLITSIIKEKRRESIKNPFLFIDRKSF
jgi:hypothetical protein